jgi:hypothetical protein
VRTDLQALHKPIQDNGLDDGLADLRLSRKSHQRTAIDEVISVQIGKQRLQEAGLVA